jgi:glucose-6-phosphate isomerase
MSLSQLAQNVEASDRIESIYKIVRHLQANKRGVVLEGNLGQPSSLKVSAAS